MKSSPRPSDQRLLESLLSSHCDSSLDADGEKQLTEILENDPESRRFYLHYIDQHLEISRRAGRSNLVPGAAEPRRSAAPLWRVAAVAAAALVLVAGALLWRQHSRPGQVSESETRAADEPVAFVSRAEQVVWDYHIPATAGLGLMGNDPIELASGKIRVEFFDGSSVTIVAPSSFTFLGNQEMNLASGQAVVRSDGPTPGFTVRTPGAAIFDVGTEFALAVVDSIGTRMHVIEGEVIASLLSEDNVALDERSAFAGEFLTLDPYDGISDADLSAGDFPQMLVPSALPLELPAEYASAILDAEPLGYWRFENLDGTAVVNEVGGDHPAIALGPLRIEGAEQGNRTAVLDGAESERGLFVSEAFPKFSSGEYSVELWFNSQSQQHGGLVSLVEVEAESIDAARGKSREHRMMTLECTGGDGSRWSDVPQGKVSFAHRLRTGMTNRDKKEVSGKDRERRGGRDDRDRRHKGGEHRHGSRDREGGEKGGRSGGHSKSRRGKSSGRSHGADSGRFAAGYRDFESRVYSRRRYAPGSWHHLVAVREADRISLYLDGELEETTQATPGSDLMDLKLIIGRYSLTSGCLGQPFHGRIDELALYGRALSAAEVRSHAGLKE